MQKTSVSHTNSHLTHTRPNPLRRSSGFTLIEIIASLALLAVLTAVFGLGLVRVMEVFAFNRANVQLAQKAQPAMMRMARELMELTRIPDNQVAGDDPFIIYTRADISQPDVRMGIHFHPGDGRIRLYTGLDPTVTTLNGDTINQGHVLIDGVSAFSLQYLKGADSWSIGSDPLDRLSTTRINLRLLRPDSPGRTQDFTTLVQLRNTANMGGAAPTQTPASINNYSCFIQSIKGLGMGITITRRGTPLPAPHISLPFSEIVWAVLCWLGLLVGCSVVVLRGRKASPCQSKKSSHGSALILVLVTLLIFSLIAAVILPMVSSSGRQTAAADWSTKAYLLAESGYRYAASRYLNAGPLDSQKNDALENLDGQTYTLINNFANDGPNDGQFELRIYSYFFEIESIAGNNRFVAHCPGSLPPPPNGMAIRDGLKLRIGKEETPFTISGTPVSGEEDDKLTITVDRDLGDITATDLVRPLVEASGDATITNGDNLSYQAGNADMFPLLNGQIEVADRILTYRYREADQFVDVRDPNDAGMSLDVTDEAPITLVRHVRLHATGRYGSGDLQAVREVIYHNPLPMPSTDTRRLQVTDRFASGSGNWSSALGQHGIGPAGPDSNSALLVQATEELGAEYKPSLAQFNPAAAEIDFNAARRATRGYLNYDAQIKIGFQTGDPTNSDYAAGLSFRLSGTAGNENMYGISFLRASSLNVGIPSGIIPESEENRILGKQLIVLWRQTDNGTSRDWLAYRDIDLETKEIAIDDTGWTLGGAWQRYEDPPRFEIDVNPSAPSNQNHDLTYESGMELPDKDRITLSFASRYTSSNSEFDDLSVEICPADKPDCDNTYPIEKRDNVTLTPMIDLRPFAGKQVRIVFRFSSSNSSHTNWLVNNIKIEADWPIENSTLLVRVIEAATLEFNSGGPDPIEAGDWVRGQTSGARGQVIQSPILSSDNWSGSGAQGILLLNRVTGLFQSTPETLRVIGKASTATSTGFNPDSDKQVNFIRAYYARASTSDEAELANDNPLDAIKLGSDGLESNLPWPPDQIEEWVPETDYFRLIEWDRVNPGISTSIDSIPDDESNKPNAITNFHPDLQSPELFIQPELGLHSMGDDATNIYFDDFGLQIDIAPATVFPLALQQ